MSSILLAGFAISGFRSFKSELQTFDGLKKITLLAGQNNAGKSNVIRVLDQHFKDPPGQPGSYDQPWGAGNVPLDLRQTIGLAIPIDRIVQLSQMLRLGNSGGGPEALGKMLRTHPILRDDPDVAWFHFARSESSDTWEYDTEWLTQLQQAVPSDIPHQLSLALYGQAGGGQYDNLVRVLNVINPLASLPPVKLLPAFRQIDDDAETSDFTPTNANLVQSIARLMQPAPLRRRQDRQKFDAINRFVQSVLGDPEAQLGVARDPEVLTVEQDGMTLPLQSLGTGIHQVIIIAAVCSLFTETLICIEEPEVHLHPLIQRKLGAYLSTETSNQYVIATHSAHLFDLANTTTFHLQRTIEGTTARRAATPASLARVCHDLGYRPSDLLHTNYAIWVEGPSDRIYLRHWLAIEDSDLIEHVHYTVMFYGGRLLNHLSASDDEVDDFIRLKTLNRNMAVVMDSDQADEGTEIRPTKLRVAAEIANAGDYSRSWITYGREVENYVPCDLLVRAVTRNQSNGSYSFTGGRFEKAIPDNVKTPRIDKIKTARRVVDLWSTELMSDQWDLADRIADLAAAVRAANGLSPRA